MSSVPYTSTNCFDWRSLGHRHRLDKPCFHDCFRFLVLVVFHCNTGAPLFETERVCDSTPKLETESSKSHTMSTSEIRVEASTETLTSHNSHSYPPTLPPPPPQTPSRKPVNSNKNGIHADHSQPLPPLPEPPSFLSHVLFVQFFHFLHFFGFTSCVHPQPTTEKTILMHGHVSSDYNTSLCKQCSSSCPAPGTAHNPSTSCTTPKSRHGSTPITMSSSPRCVFPTFELVVEVLPQPPRALTFSHALSYSYCSSRI